MHTTIVMPEHLEVASEALRRGLLVAFPTETVYGLGADGLNGVACQDIFRAKRRPQDNPLILHVLDRSGLLDIAGEKLPTQCEKLIQAFWPGPLTVVIKSSPRVPKEVRAGLDTVAVRAPSHPIARRLIEGVGHPLAAPSANLSGRPSPTTFDAVFEDLNGRVPYIVKGSATQVGVESTVVDCTTDPITLLRPGGIGVERLAEVVGDVAQPQGDGPVRAPGMKYRHYAPQAPLVWIHSDSPVVIKHHLSDLQSRYGRLAILAPDSVELAQSEWVERLGPDAASAAHRLFGAIRALDAQKPPAIVVVWKGMRDVGLAVSNRLAKAASIKVD